jgi:hypothetical protein
MGGDNRWEGRRDEEQSHGVMAKAEMVTADRYCDGSSTLARVRAAEEWRRRARV